MRGCLQAAGVQHALSCLLVVCTAPGPSKFLPPTLCAGERLCDELAPELTSLLSTVQMPANFIPVTNTVRGDYLPLGCRQVPCSQLLCCVSSSGCSGNPSNHQARHLT